MKRSLESDQELATTPVSTCEKRMCLNHADPKDRLTLDEISHGLAGIKAWTDAITNWESLASPIPGVKVLAADWLKDYVLGHYEPHHNGQFVLFVRKVLAPVFRRHDFTAEMTRIMDVYYKHCTNLGPDWETPIELLLTRLLFGDGYQEDFLALARELIGDGDKGAYELIALCCWAIAERQRGPRHGQQDYTRSAVTNVIALILALKKGPAFTYISPSYAFVFADARATDKAEVWMPDFARFWFGVEMPNFVEKPSRIDVFRAKC